MAFDPGPKLASSIAAMWVSQVIPKWLVKISAVQAQKPRCQIQYLKIHARSQIYTVIIQGWQIDESGLSTPAAAAATANLIQFIQRANRRISPCVPRVPTPLSTSDGASSVADVTQRRVTSAQPPASRRPLAKQRRSKPTLTMARIILRAITSTAAQPDLCHPRWTHTTHYFHDSFHNYPFNTCP